MKKAKCKKCGYVYDPLKGDKSQGIETNTPFEDLPHDWRCPLCGAEKKDFILER
jgi:rubredoxin